MAECPFPPPHVPTDSSFPRGDRFRQSEAVLRAILESPAEIVIFALDREYRYLAFNQNHTRTIRHIWGVDIHVGDCMLEIIGRDDDRARAKKHFDRALAGESFTVVEEYGDENMHRAVYQDQYNPIRAENGQIIGLTLYLTDVTEQKRAEAELANYRLHLEDLVRERTEALDVAHAQLLHTQKLESLGVLAGGIAHDFNNLLAVVLARSELGKLASPKGELAYEHFDIICQTVLEARDLTKHLLSYSGKGKFWIEEIELDSVINDSAQLLRASVKRSITLAFELRRLGKWVIEADATQIRQVVMNLVTNAAEAIGDETGRVVVRTGLVDVDDAMLRLAFGNSGALKGLYAFVEVEDDGCGMDQSVRCRIFDPFFTTKFSGRGLGLAAVLGIVRGHRGVALVDSEPGRGTRVRMLFPAVQRARTIDSEISPSTLPSFHADGIVLVVDDEAPVRKATADMLASLGYETLVADGGKQACDLFRQHADRVCLVLLDLTMPELSGKQTLAELRSIRPDIGVILLTGYSEDQARLSFPNRELAGFLAKPFAREELIAALEGAHRSDSGPDEEGSARSTESQPFAS